MTVTSRVLLACLALSGAACVSEPLQPPRTEWAFQGDDIVSTGGATGAFMPSSPALAQQDEGFPFDLITAAGPGDLDDDVNDPFGGQGASPYHRLGNDVIRGIDGSYTKLYRIRGGRGGDIVTLLQAYVPGFPAAENTPSDPTAGPTQVIRYALQANFYKDDMGEKGSIGTREPSPVTNIADVLHVTAPPETLLYIDELLHKVLADQPQVELEVRVVEVNLDDTIDWDSKVLARKLEDPRAPFDAVTNPPDGNFGAGLPILDGNQESGIGAGFTSFAQSAVSLSGFLLSLQGVHDNLVVDGVLSFLQTVGSAEIISSPTITVLNGHRAKLATGDKLPIFKAGGNVNNPNVTTSFEPTGVTIDMVPFLVTDDLVRIDVSINVSTQTGAVPFSISGVEVSSPIISTREAGTTVHVYSGQVFALGGLKSSTTIENITKVPLLGDIPILGWLFKSRTSQKRNTEILFFITPRVIIPSESLLDPLEAYESALAP